MAVTYKKTVVKGFPRVGEKITRDTLYWKNFEFPVTKKEYGAVSYIDFCPVKPYDYAITSSGRVQIYNGGSSTIDKTISKFREVAYCGTFRNDGRLLVAGGDDPNIKLFDVSTKSLLRAFRGHTAPVHLTKFMSDNLHIISGSDDKTVRIWDLPTEQEVISYSEHKDHIRCGCASQASRDIAITGGYDHLVKLFDTRMDSSVLTVDHGYPVESVLMFPSGGTFISAGGNFIKVWSALSGGKLLASVSNHHKTVTSLCFSSDCKRLLSGSLDRHVKIYDISTYQVVHTLDYPGSILSVGISPDDSLLAVGLADGLLSIQHRKEPEDRDAKLIKKNLKEKKKARPYRYDLSGKNYVQTNEEFVPKQQKNQLAKYDEYFRKFEYTKALDAAFHIYVRRRYPEVTISVLQELIRRRGIKAALAGRDEKSLEPILRFAQKNISNPKYMSTLIDISLLLTDMYSSQIGHSTIIDDLFLSLQRTISQETLFMKQMMQTLGTMDILFAASTSQLSEGMSTMNIDPIAPSENADSLRL
ncbi:U3 small nucleolar RNA-associated protein 15 homolog [Tubulanus polymorphus]|uniref:U3 small nucleolar RNA-associated protein 15 homolog n=1 Tax=Tubulanus polymorphus TaxID=672921 RepID=UPI003DA441F3